MKNKFRNNLNRRDFIKFGGLAGFALSLFGAAGAGYFSGKSKESYTGWGKDAYGENQFFNRKPFRRNNPTYKKVGETRRIEYLENIFKILTINKRKIDYHFTFH